MKIRSSTLREVQQALERYEREVKDSRLSPKAKWTYIRHASTFVRWLDDDFTPGERVDENR